MVISVKVSGIFLLFFYDLSASNRILVEIFCIMFRNFVFLRMSFFQTKSIFKFKKNIVHLLGLLHD